MKVVTLIAAEARITSRWAIGTIAGADDAVKLPVAIDPRNKAVVIPGSSIVGSLRRHLGARADEWLGLEPEAFEQAMGDRTPRPSRLALLGSRVEASTNTAGSTMIDPRRGAASGRGLRYYEWADGSPRVMVALQHDGPVDATLVEQLYSWPLYLGRGRSAGLGQAQVTRVHTLTLDLSKERDLRFWLGPRTEWFEHPVDTGAGVYASPPGRPVDYAWTKVALMTREPLHVGDGHTRQVGERRVKEPVRLTPGGRPFIPGSSWRGIFRHRMHAILSAVGATDIQCADILEGLFGSTDRGRGPLWFSDSTLPEALLVRTHVAIDRFTGGAHPGLLFTVTAVRHHTEFDLRYRWDRGRMPAAVQNLINHVICDLHEGLASVGGMGTRGYGWVTVQGELPARAPVVVDDVVLAVADPNPEAPLGEAPEGNRQ